MAATVANITGGPAKVLVDGTQISHTQGGVTVKVSPQNRMRIVDQYGSTPVAVIHTGDDMRVTVPHAQWDQAVLRNVYDPGLDNLSSSAADEYLGIGRSAGYSYDDKVVRVVPYLTGDARKCVEVYKAVPVGEIELVHNNEDDRVFNQEFVGLVDETKSDGNLVGCIFRDDVP